MAYQDGIIPNLIVAVQLTLVILVLTMLFVVIYLLAGWKNAIERQLEALQGKVTELYERIVFNERH